MEYMLDLDENIIGYLVADFNRSSTFASREQGGTSIDEGGQERAANFRISHTGSEIYHYRLSEES